MQYRRLGSTETQVSQICLGSMTWGTQNTEDEGHAQIDCALDHGVNFIDTAEMYPTNPLSPDHAGRTEEIIGRWFERSGRRDDVVLATKIIGEGSSIVRNGLPITPETIRVALEGSLRRLKTDYVDLYQLHWPNRGSYHFRKSWRFDPTTQDRDETVTHMREVLEELQRHIEAGRIRYIGLSNETPWAVMHFLQLAEQHSLPRIVTVQNPYNLLNRSYEVGLAEISWREKAGLLAYSPLGFGVLSGKYLDGARPEGGRITLFPEYTRYSKPAAITATQKYVALARNYDLDPAQMALSYVHSRPFLTSTIIGATTMEQLSSNIDSINVELPAEVVEGIEAIHNEYPNPSP